MLINKVKSFPKPRKLVRLVCNKPSFIWAIDEGHSRPGHHSKHKQHQGVGGQLAQLIHQLLAAVWTGAIEARDGAFA